MFITNLTEIIKDEVLENKYYMCNIEKAKKLVLNGFIPISVNNCQYYIFYKNEPLIKFLQEGELK